MDGQPAAGPAVPIERKNSKAVRRARTAAANALVGSGAGTLRSRHALRRYVTFLQRVQTGSCILRFLPDAQNPADFLTKPVPAAKLESSKLWLQGKPP